MVIFKKNCESINVQNQNKSLIKGLSILKKIMLSKEALTANLLCQKLDIDKSTMSRLLNTLIAEQFIEYKANSKEIIMSDLMRNIMEKEDREKLISKTQGLLDEIFYLTNECAYLGILDNDAVLYLNQVDKSKRVLKTRNSIGFHAPLHSNGFGKVLLAFNESIDLCALKLTKLTPKTITCVTKLQKELALVRQRGYAIGSEEHEFGLRSLGVAYFNSKKEFVGTVGISGLSVRLDEVKLHALGKQIFKLANPSIVY
jgi:IclR family transcriptional regulator, KDG regulon repressor